MKLDFLENMTVDEKVELVEEIWDNIEKDYIKINEDVKAELDRRMARMKEGESVYFTVEEVFDRIRKKRLNNISVV